MKKVCQLTKEQKLNSENNENENKPDEALAELNELTETTNEDTNKSASTNKPTPGVGRGKRKREVTMPEAVNRFYIYKVNNKPYNNFNFIPANTFREILNIHTNNS